jgi:hypothetical protein
VKHGRRQVADELQRQQDAAAMRTAAVEGITAKSGAPTTTAQLESVVNAAAALLRLSVSVMPLVSLGAPKRPAPGRMT